LTTNHLSLGTDLIPGIYFLKLKAGEYTETKKIIKIR
ncbi:MAG: T9SS type A sorting domain-containing protein, partial [Candidatus Heimdallarchaeota archaeon]